FLPVWLSQGGRRAHSDRNMSESRSRLRRSGEPDQAVIVDIEHEPAVGLEPLIQDFKAAGTRRLWAGHRAGSLGENGQRYWSCGLRLLRMGLLLSISVAIRAQD